MKAQNCSFPVRRSPESSDNTSSATVQPSAITTSNVTPVQVTVEQVLKQRGRLDVTVSSGADSVGNATIKVLLAENDEVAEAFTELCNRELRGDFSEEELELHIAARGVGVGKSQTDSSKVRPLACTNCIALFVGLSVYI